MEITQDIAGDSIHEELEDLQEDLVDLEEELKEELEELQEEQEEFQEELEGLQEELQEIQEHIGTEEKYKLSEKKLLAITITHSVIIAVVFTLVVVYQDNQKLIAISTNATVCEFSLNNYFHFGPSSSLCFINLKLDDWGKWFIAVLVTIILDAISILNIELYNPWANNCLARPKIKISAVIAHLIQQLQWINFYLEKAIYIFLALTQIDLLLFAMVGALGVTFYNTHTFLRAKSTYVPKKRNDLNEVVIDNINNNDIPLSEYM